jgi:hypothetical protein
MCASPRDEPSHDGGEESLSAAVGITCISRIIRWPRVTGIAALESGPDPFDHTNASACICVHPWFHFFLNGVDHK